MFDLISDERICQLGISPATCVDWAAEAFRHKDECLLSPKICQKPTPDSFFTTMPCCVPMFNRMGVKVISRLPGGQPTLKSDIMLFDMTTGERSALMGGNWITAMRTGAVATLAARAFVSGFETASYGIVGLGNIARAVLKCLVSQVPAHGSVDIWLLRFRGEENAFMADFASESRVSFHLTDDRESLVRNTIALFSCVTVMNEQFLPPETYPSGYTLIPIHTKGFQDCDLVFDHIFGDDLEHESVFGNFPKFRSFAEMRDVLLGKEPGRRRAGDRIISYNVGIALHDIWFASKIQQLLKGTRQ